MVYSNAPEGILSAKNRLKIEAVYIYHSFRSIAVLKLVNLMH